MNFLYNRVYRELCETFGDPQIECLISPQAFQEFMTNLVEERLSNLGLTFVGVA